MHGIGGKSSGPLENGADKIDIEDRPPHFATMS